MFDRILNMPLRQADFQQYCFFFLETRFSGERKILFMAPFEPDVRKCNREVCCKIGLNGYKKWLKLLLWRRH